MKGDIELASGLTSVLAERAHADGARSMRAVEVSPVRA